MRYLGPANANYNIAEMEFYGVDVRPDAATPTFSLAEGTYGIPQTVTISTTTSGTTLRYTTDGGLPTASSSIYCSDLTLTSNTKLRAIASHGSLTDSLIATASYTLTGFVGWTADTANFPANASSADRLHTADPDGDGLVNLLEYALDSDPLASSRSDLPVVATVGSPHRLTLTFNRNPTLTDLTYTVEAASDLSATDAGTAIARSTDGATTSNFGGLYEITETGTAIKSVTVLDFTNLNTITRRFLRLKVTQP